MAFAATTTPATSMPTRRPGTTGTGRPPRLLAKVLHTGPTGDHAQGYAEDRADTAKVVACQATTEATDLSQNPRHLHRAISRRRRDTLTTSKWAKVAARKGPG